MVKVTFIIVNFNGKAFIESCLDSIKRQTFSDFEIVVVDNGSHDGSVEFLQQKYPSVTLIALEKNLGFTGGNNAGLKKAHGKYIALINNDIVLDENWLSSMINGIETQSDLGLCSSKIIIAGTDKIDSVGDNFTSAFTGTKIGEYQPERIFGQSFYVNGACAAAALYKREMIDVIGFFNDMFFLNHEDTDLNMRAWLAGYRCKFIPGAVAYHDVNRTIGTLSDVSVYYFSRNNVWVYLINVPFYFMVTNCFQRLFYEICSAIYFCIVHRKYKPYLKGKFDAVLSLKKIFKTRKNIQKLIKISNSQIRGEMISIFSYICKKKRRSDFLNFKFF